MKFPVFSQLAGNWPSETSSLVTASSSGESLANLTSEDGAARSGKNSGWGQRPHAATRVPEFNDIVRLSRQVLDGPQGRAAGCAAQRTD